MFFIVSARRIIIILRIIPCITPVVAHQLRTSMMAIQRMLCCLYTPPPHRPHFAEKKTYIYTYLHHRSQRSRGVKAQHNATLPSDFVGGVSLYGRLQNKSHACVVSMWIQKTHSHRCNTSDGTRPTYAVSTDSYYACIFVFVI